MTQSKHLLKTTLLLGIGRGCYQIVSLLLIPIYTLHLSPEEFGCFDLVLSYGLLLAPSISLQMEMAVFRFLVDARGNSSDSQKVITASASVIAASSLLVCAIAFGIHALRPDVQALTLGGYLASLIVVNYLLQVVRGLGRNGIYAVGSLVQGTVLALATVFFIIKSHMGFTGALVAVILGNIVTAIILIVVAKIWQYISHQHFDRASIRAQLRYAIPLVPNGVSMWGMNLASRTIIILVLGAASNGIFAIASRISSILTAIFSIFYLAWTDSVASNISTSQGREFLSKAYSYALATFTLLAALLISATPLLAPVVLGEAFESAANLVPGMVVTSVLSIITTLYGGWYIGLKSTGLLMRSTVVFSVGAVCLTAIGAVLFGLWGVITAMGVAFALLASYRHFELRRLGVIARIPLGAPIVTGCLLVGAVLVFIWSDTLMQILYSAFVFVSMGIHGYRLVGVLRP